MRLGLLGYGKMGKAIAALAPMYGHTITSIINRNDRLNEKNTLDVDLFLDFTEPQAVPENISQLISLGKSVVIGTTGWSLPELHDQKEIGILYSPNFSLGVQIFTLLVKQAAEKLKDYHVALHEEHHSQKIDAPSGTAKQLLKHLPNCPVTSLRLGSIVGKHEVIFDSPLDQIRLTHEAKTRDAFAHGAIKGAEWLNQRKGTFTLEDMLA